MKLLTKKNKVGLGLLVIALAYYFFPFGNDLAYYVLMYTQGQTFLNATATMYAITIALFLIGCWLAEVESITNIFRKFGRFIRG